MKKIVFVMLILFITSAFAQYSVGDIVDPSDNISWTISGPAGHPEVGSSSDIFNMVSMGKPVVIFFGATG